MDRNWKNRRSKVAWKMMPHFTPKHWLLCHMGLRLFEFEFEEIDGPVETGQSERNKAASVEIEYEARGAFLVDKDSAMAARTDKLESDMAKQKE